MRKRAEWMNTASDPVLELLNESGLALPPGAIYYNLDRQMGSAPSQATVTRAIDDLLAHGFIHKPENAKTYYEITDRGRAYLRGELDASEVTDE
jgi:Fe2+ or Zn2+ uptake regulation protein